MLVTTADHWQPRPGTVVSWDVTAAGSPHEVRLSLNQRNHVDAFLAGEPSVWLAAAFDVDGPIDVSALESAYRSLVARHSVLQCGVVADGETVRGVRHDPASLRWVSRVEARTSSIAQTRDVVRSALDRSCVPADHPAFWPAAISRPDRSTIIYGLDHLHTDAYSLAVLVDDLHVLYAAHAGGGSRPVLPKAGCFVTSQAEPPSYVAPDDARLAAWHDFLRARDHRLPTFPLDLGVEEGERAPQLTMVRDLVDDATTGRVAEHAARHGASTSSAVLAALGQAVHDVGGPERLAVLVPVHTRTAEEDRRAVGWYTATVPLELEAHDDRCRALRRAGASLVAARELADVPLDQVLETADAPLVRERADVFLVSYLDYRRLPGSGELERRVAHHVSAPTRADDLQLWISRTDAGLAARARMPDTAAARQAIGRLLDRWAARLTSIGTVQCGWTAVTASPSGRPAGRS